MAAQRDLDWGKIGKVAAGAVLGGPIGAGAAIGEIGSEQTAEAIEKAGKAQKEAADFAKYWAEIGVNQQAALRENSIALAQETAKLSPEEISSINRILTTRDQSFAAAFASIKKQQSTLDAMGPQVQAAGQNYYDLLSGKAAAILKPMQDSLRMQREQLVSNLASQMGPGFMTSSAGIEALTKFDTQASLTLNQAQMGALTTIGQQYGSLVGLQQKGQESVTGSMLQTYQQGQQANEAVMQGYEVGQNRLTNATMGAMAINPIDYMAPSKAAAAGVSVAGAQYGGQAYMGQFYSGVGGQLMGAGTQVGAAMVGAQFAGAGRTTIGASGGGGGTVYGADLDPNIQRLS